MILQQIKQHQLALNQKLQKEVSFEQLKDSAYFSAPINSLKYKLKNKSSNGIIAEFKRKSPSKGNINLQAKVEEVIPIYEKNNVAAISVLTNEAFFGATSQDFTITRKLTNLPLLRKDFIVEPYQVYQTKAMGADILLLIAKMLDPNQLQEMAQLANEIGLEVLVEFHEAQEINLHKKTIMDFAGINQRNLNNFEMHLQQANDLIHMLPKEVFKIAESGILDANTFHQLKNKGYDAFLIGEYFMKSDAITEAFNELILK
jgi:indole-3-glycerol phosphate synthase